MSNPDAYIVPAHYDCFCVSRGPFLTSCQTDIIVQINGKRYTLHSAYLQLYQQYLEVLQELQGLQQQHSSLEGLLQRFLDQLADAGIQRGK